MTTPSDHERGAQGGDPRLPIIDLHCDLLAYLATVEGSTPDNTDDMGCAIPFLRDGNVKLQVLAAYVPSEPHSADLAAEECRRFGELPNECPGEFHHVTTIEQVEKSLTAKGTGVITAIENASALCTELEPLDVAFTRLERIVERVEKLLYITLTHHGANRFGGGNMTDVGLKDDGKALIEHMSGMGIAVDMSHTSDQLARGMLDHIDDKGLDVPLLASHSNFRTVFDHARNLPDWLAREIVDRGGVIGINFIRAFVHLEDPSYLERHILYGHENGLGAGLCFGADFFYWKGALDQGRVPFYHPEHENAARYQAVLNSLGMSLGRQELEALAFGNALRFLRRVWT
jgi:microsomal dipeptidase-like Zn-dependent dipeptidase